MADSGGILNMNNQRRKKIEKLSEELSELKDKLEEIMEEEQECLDNIPENLQDTERYETAEEAVNALVCAVSSIDEALDNLETAIE